MKVHHFLDGIWCDKLSMAIVAVMDYTGMFGKDFDAAAAYLS